MFQIKTRCLFTFLIILLADISFSQKRQDKTQSEFHPRSTKLSFNQELNIYQWNYLLNYKKSINNHLDVNINEIFTSTLQNVASTDLWKDEQNLSIAFRFPLKANLSANAEFDSHILKDPLAGFDNDVTYNSGTASLTYTPRVNMSFAPSFSNKWQKQQDQQDHGLGYGINAEIINFDFYGYKSDLSFIGEQDFFPQRKNHDIRLRYRLERQFYEETTDTLFLIVDRLRRDSFDSDGTNIFVRNLVQTSQGIDNRLSYKVSSSSQLYFTNTLLSTRFKVNNLKEEENEIRKDDSGYESGNLVRLNISKAPWFSNLSWHYRLRTREDNRPGSKPDPFGRFPTVGFDTEDVLVKLSTANGLRISNSDSIGMSASASKFQYSTSDTTNPNDHDQQKWQITFSHAHIFNEDLKIVWGASAFLNHFVFISKKFSSNNNWERNFQLTPEIIYTQGNRFYFRQRFTVRAKYQTYDFDEPETSNRNIVNRQFIINTFSVYRFSPKSRFEISVNYELAEQGRFFYDLWRQTLALSWQNSEVQLFYKHKLGSQIYLSTGGSFFRQIRWEHKIKSDGKTEKIIKDKHTNYGPSIELSYRPNNSLEINFLGNIHFADSSRKKTDTINIFDINLTWFF